MCELYGKDNFDLFSELLLGGKTIEEIEVYSEAFWKNHTQIDNYKKYLDRIEKGAQEIAKRLAIDKAIDDKFIQLRDRFLEANPGKTIKDFTFEEIEIVYDKAVTEEDLEENPFDFYPAEDKIYALGMFKYTYGYWDLLKNEIRNCPYFLFNWVVQTRTPVDIQKRCDYLITLFKKELYEKPKKKAVKKRPRKGADSEDGEMKSQSDKRQKVEVDDESYKAD
jgi:SWI/SNF-related matrix-associated actin-dependent regulator of chromatin subfamily A member 5